MNSFSTIGLSSPIQKALDELGFETPTEIQQKALPILLHKKCDFIGLAQTGTGKTAAFGLPLLEAIQSKNRNTQALVLSPTRELGQQIAEQLQSFAAYLPAISVQAVYGGAPIVQQIKALKQGAQVIIATPGRLIDLIGRKAIKLEHIDYLVLDEADEMLNMGFKEDIDKILSFTPQDKATWLFSATMPREIRSIVNQYMDHDAAEVSVSTGKEVNKNIEHQFAVVKHSHKAESLKRFMDVDTDMRGIVFCRTKVTAQSLAEELAKAGYRVEALHGDLSQSQRDRVMRRFKAHSLQVLIATDVAARGIDVNNLSHVIHYNLPDSMDYYTHRSGRTARAGKKGISLALVSGRELSKVQFLEKKLKVSFAKVAVPSAEAIRTQRVLQWASTIADTQVLVEPESELMEQTRDLFKAFSKSELIAKLVTNELKALQYDGNDRDLNDHASKGSDRPKRERRGDGHVERFFINIGSMDRIGKRELIDFISTEAQINKKDIGDISLQKTCAYFDVDKRSARKVLNSFKGLAVDGRKIRVNRDDAGSRKRRRK